METITKWLEIQEHTNTILLWNKGIKIFTLRIIENTGKHDSKAVSWMFKIFNTASSTNPKNTTPKSSNFITEAEVALRQLNNEILKTDENVFSEFCSLYETFVEKQKKYGTKKWILQLNGLHQSWNLYANVGVEIIIHKENIIPRISRSHV